MVRLKSEIAQQRPFTSLHEEALLNLARTNDCLHRAFYTHCKHFGVTSTQYDVLRILRGSNPKGLTCSDIGDRMVTADPDITRLLRRLAALGFIRQKRDAADRRVVRTFISSKGLELLAQMDPIIAKLPVELLGHIDRIGLQQLIGLLEQARLHCGADAAAASCDGKNAAELCVETRA